MKPQIYYQTKGSIFIDPKLSEMYIIKAPTRKNRLNKNGSAGLRMAEKYDLEHNKKGIVFIDHTLKSYVILPKDLLNKPTGKECNGVKNSIFSYNVNSLVRDHNLEIIPIPNENEVVPVYETGLAGDIRRKFGL